MAVTIMIIDIQQINITVSKSYTVFNTCLLLTHRVTEIIVIIRRNRYDIIFLCKIHVDYDLT